MPKLYLLVGNLSQKNASLFARHAKDLGLKLEAVILLNNVDQVSLGLVQRAFNKLMRMIPLSRIFKKLLAGSQHIQLDEVNQSWVQMGMNSWDLLKPGGTVSDFLPDVPVRRPSAWTAESIFNQLDEEESYIATYGGGILTSAFTTNPKVHFLNAHMGRMPKYRGMEVIEWAVYQDEPTYSTVMRLEDAIDGGAVLHEKLIDRSEIKDLSDLRRTGYSTCALAMAEAMLGVQEGRLKFEPQQGKGTYYYRMHGAVRSELKRKLNQEV